MRTHRLIINDHQITYYTSDVFSVERPTIFLHGWGSNGLVFEPLFSHVENWLSIDWPGFGASELPRDDWFLDNYIDVLHSLIQTLQVHNPTLVGHSFGGSVVIRYCATHPNAYPIVLIGSAGIREKSLSVRIKGSVAKAVKVGTSGLPGFVRNRIMSIGSRLGSTDYQLAGPLKRTMANVLAQDLKTDLPAVGNRTTLIWGEGDIDTPLSYAKTMHALLPSSELYIVPNAGHYCFLDNTPAFLDYFKLTQS